MSTTTMIFSLAPAVAPIIGGWAHVAFGWRAVFAIMVMCGVIFAFFRLVETAGNTSEAARIPFNAATWCRRRSASCGHPEFLVLAFAAGSISAPSRTHWCGADHRRRYTASTWKRSTAALFVPIIAGILIGAWGSGRIAGKVDLVYQVRIGIRDDLAVSLVRVILHLSLDDVPIVVQQALLFLAGLGAQFAFPVLTLRMLDLFPAARGTAASLQSSWRC